MVGFIQLFSVLTLSQSGIRHFFKQLLKFADRQLGIGMHVCVGILHIGFGLHIVTCIEYRILISGSGITDLLFSQIFVALHHINVGA